MEINSVGNRVRGKGSQRGGKRGGCGRRAGLQIGGFSGPGGRREGDLKGNAWIKGYIMDHRGATEILNSKRERCKKTGKKKYKKGWGRPHSGI